MGNIWKKDEKLLDEGSVFVSDVNPSLPTSFSVF